MTTDRHFSVIELKEYMDGNYNNHISNSIESHLLECEECMESYITLNEKNTHSPSDSFNEIVMESIRQESFKQSKKRAKITRANLLICYFSAACITLFFISSGIFSFIFHNTPKPDELLDTAHYKASTLIKQGWSEKLTEGTSQFIKGISSFDHIKFK